MCVKAGLPEFFVMRKKTEKFDMGIKNSGMGRGKKAEWECIKINQPSFSSTFNVRVFRTKFWRQKLQSCVLGLKFFGTKFLTKNAPVKC